MLAKAPTVDRPAHSDQRPALLMIGSALFMKSLQQGCSLTALIFISDWIIFSSQFITSGNNNAIF